MRMEILKESRLVGYADNMAVLIIAHTIDQAQIKFNRVMRLVKNRMVTHGLLLGLSKMELKILTKKRILNLILV